MYPAIFLLIIIWMLMATPLCFHLKDNVKSWKDLMVGEIVFTIILLPGVILNYVFIFFIDRVFFPALLWQPFKNKKNEEIK